MEVLQQIKKRNGTVALFDSVKITEAIKKAFDAVRGNNHEHVATYITEAVVRELSERFAKEGAGVPTVEHIQDLVEKNIMAAGFFDVAKSYILYRYEHTKVREEKKAETAKKIEENELFVTKRDGAKEPFSPEKLRRSLSHAVKGYEDTVNLDAIVAQCKLEIFEGITTKDISRTLVMVTRSQIEQDPAYSHVASRLVLREVYGEVIGEDKLNMLNLDAQYREAFKEGIRYGVSIKRLDERMLGFDLNKLALALDPSRDELFRYLGMQTLYDRYFTRDQENGNRVIELPQAFWMRVAMGLSFFEDNREERVIEFYETISKLLFVPSTPTLFHSGTVRPQLSSCYLNTVPDSLDEIFKSYSDNSQLSKYSGGIGTDWTSVRATGSLIKGTGVESNGIIPFLKIANDVTVAINRSGRRRGAACVYLEVWHYDIEDFMELRKNTGDERRRTHDMNTAAWVPDLFMKRVRDDEDWTLFSPDEVPLLHETYGRQFEALYVKYEEMAKNGDIRLWKIMPARDLWKRLVNMLYETGHPWITFKDPSNIRSPQDHVGVVHNSNLCTEITLNNSSEETAVCNLGSVNFATHMTSGVFDRELIAKTVHVAMRMLDNVIDVNFYPTKEAETSNMRHRPVGLGIMGYHDALYLQGIDFDSEEAVRFADESMEVVSYHAILASTELARERGSYSSFKGSKWDRGILPVDTIAILEEERGDNVNVPRGGILDWSHVRQSIKKHGMRNSNCMAIAPTATISNISGCLPCIEPIYKNIYVKSNQSGDFTVVNSYLVEDLKKRGLWDFEMLGKLKYNDGSLRKISEIPADLKEKYKETFEISPEWLVKAAARRGKWIDQSQSLNIYYSGTSGRELASIYMYAWEAGLKTTYYLRTLGASQVEKSTVNASEFGSTHTRGSDEGGGEGTDVSGGEPVENTPSSVFSPMPSNVPSNIVASITETVMFSVPAVSQSEPKLCKILDPDCEACQ